MKSGAFVSLRQARRADYYRAWLTVAAGLLVLFPSVAEATVYRAGGSTLAGSPSIGALADCGYNFAGSYDSGFVTLGSGNTQDAGGHLYTTMNVNLDILAGLGSTGYEYLEGEFYFGCYNVPATGSWYATLTITPSAFSIGGSAWYAVFVTPDRGTSGVSYSAVQGDWCNPTSSAQGGTSCSGTAVPCGSYTPSMYLPVNTQVALTQGSSGNEWVYVNGGYVSAGATCGKNTAGPTGLLLTATTGAQTYVEDLGFAFGDTGASISGSLAFSYSLTT